MFVYWIFGILVLAIMAAIVVAVVVRPEKRRAADRRRRYTLEANGTQRIPLAPERERASSNGELAAESSDRPAFAGNRLIDHVRESGEPIGAEAEDPVVTARLVQTPDGEELLTAPPFALRPHLLGRRLGRYCNGLARRLPVWLVACPRVRLDALVTPTPPDGRDPDDWARWRSRVRVRAVDLVIADRRTWHPVLVIMLEPAPGAKFSRSGTAGGTSSALVLARGQDRMIDEVLAHVGLPLVRGSGELAADWPVIEPYINETILKTVSEEDLLAADHAASPRPDPEAAVKLLKMDADGGWLLD